MRNITDFWRKRNLPVALTCIPEPTYRQKTPEQMVAGATEAIGNWEASGSNLPPVFMPDFGTVTMAKPWGGRVVKTDDGQIFIHPVSTDIEAVLDIEPRRNPDIDLAVDLYNEVCRRTGRSDIRFVTPDFQGVLGTAGQVMKEEELLIAMYTHPAKVHAFLDLVCRRSIEFIEEFKRRIGHIDGGIWPYIWLPDEIGVVITEDMMPLLSPQMYKEFGLPYLQRISDAFGGVFIHSCGQWIQHAEVMAESGINYLGVDFCYPYAKLQEIQRKLPHLVLQPGFEFNIKNEYADYAEFLDAMIQSRDEGTCLWPATNSNPAWGMPKVRQVLAKHGIEIETYAK